MNKLAGSYNNFLQYWKQNTEDEIHREITKDRHEHVHLKVDHLSADTYRIEIFKGRNNVQFVGSTKWDITAQNENIIINDNEVLIRRLDGITSHSTPYQFRKCRMFSGFIELQLPDHPEEYYRMGNIELHDQGAMIQLDYPDTAYTIELTQLVFAHKIPLMKVAIYDLPLQEVGINSKAISYAWTSPDANRIGINTRKIVTGWTLIEEGFLSSNNLDLEKS